MLNITSSPPVAWPSAPATGVSSVPAATAVTPVQSSARDSQAGLGQGRERPSPEAVRRGRAQPAEVNKERTAPDAAPILPRESPDSPDGRPAVEQTEEQAKAEREKAAEQVAEKALKQQLQDVLSNVWKASAAVVDVVLGREISATESQAGGAAIDATGAVSGAGEAAVIASRAVASAVSQAAARVVLPGDSGPEAANDGSAATDARSPQDVVAYDAHGNSSWAPLESGSLISRRV